MLLSLDVFTQLLGHDLYFLSQIDLHFPSSLNH